MKEIGVNSLFVDSRGYSTVFDALFLLVLVSLSGVMLLPSLSAEEQYNAAGYTAGSCLDSHVLEALLTCSPETFDYEISPFTVLEIPYPSNSVVASPTRTLFGKEQIHRNFADLTAENLAFNLTLSGNGTSICANPFAADNVARASDTLDFYLKQEFAGRYCYRFEAYWHPVEVLPLSSELVLGKDAPVSAIRQSAKLSMPSFTYTPSKEALLECVNDSVLETALNASDEEGAIILSEAFSSSLDAAAQEGSLVVVDLLFPSEYFGSVFGENAEEEESMQTLLYGAENNLSGPVSGLTAGNITGPKEAFFSFFAGRLSLMFSPGSENSSANSSVNSSVNSFANFSTNSSANSSTNFSEGHSGNVSTKPLPAPDLPSLETMVTSLVRLELRTALDEELSPQINSTVSGILEAGSLSEARALRDTRVESIYRKINPGGARVVLCLWSPS